MSNFDIFVKAIDNFGDISIAYRLAEGLSTKSNPARLFIKKDAVFDEFHNLQPDHLFILVDINQIERDVVPAKNIISIFDTLIPDHYLANIKEKTNLYIYEYLSAESWIDDFHYKPSFSTNPNCNKKYFYPGFSEASGGLLLDKNFNDSKPFSLVQLITSEKKQNKKLMCSFFYYPHTNLQKLMMNFMVVKKSYSAFVLEGITQLSRKECESMNINPFKMVSMNQYDQLLLACYINFVRGEDSLCRAIFAKKPFIWQPYSQKNNLHLDKLNAFINFFYAEADKSVVDVVRSANIEWSAGCISSTQLRNYLNLLDYLTEYHFKKSSSIMLKKTVFENLKESCRK